MRVPFDKVIDLLKEYESEHGNLIVPQKYTTPEGIRLGGIVHNIRAGSRKTSEEEKAELNALGFVWTREVPFDKVIRLMEEYKEEHGNLLVPAKYQSKSGINLGMIVQNIRTGGRKVSEEQVARLDELGFVWKCEISFGRILKLLEEYKNEHGDVRVPARYKTVDGINLGTIVRNIRKGMRQTTWKEKARLQQLGFVWKCR